MFNVESEEELTVINEIAGKLKMNKDSDSEDPKDYNYTATVIYPDEASMKKDKTIFDKFWRENKPKGCTKQNYDMFKPEKAPTLDDAGKEQFDEDDAIINYVGHPVSGAIYYTMARNDGLDPFESFLFSTLMSSFFWEANIEAIG